MAHTRADVTRIRNAYFAASDASITATKDMIDMLQCQLRAEENARRAVTMVMGEDEVLTLTERVTAAKPAA